MDLPVLRRRHHNNGQDHEHPRRWGEHHHGGELARGAVGPRGWSPWAEFNALYERMGRLLADVWDQDDGGGWRPAADVEETGEAYLVEVELPGVKREDMTIEYGAGELTISGELKERHRVGLLRSRTRPVGHFRYQVSLPAEVEDSQISASLEAGVLTVRVPKAASARARKIPISS